MSVEAERKAYQAWNEHREAATAAASARKALKVAERELAKARADLSA